MLGEHIRSCRRVRNCPGSGGLTAYHHELRTNAEDLKKHSDEWRAGIEERRAASEIHLLRTVSELQSAFHLRASVIEQKFRESVRQQHDDFTNELDRRTLDIQKRLWQDMEKIRGEYDRLIHTELRLLRQKLATGITAVPTSTLTPAPQERLDIDWARFAEQFRGSEDRIREQQKCYVARFAGSPGEILDIGCGRGEFLDAAKAAGLAARGIDQNQESVALCRSKGLDVEQGDMFEYLEALAEGSLGGAYCAQVVEHLPPAGVPAIGEAARAEAEVGSAGGDRDAQPGVPGDLRDAFLPRSRRIHGPFRPLCCAFISKKPGSAVSRSSA